MRQFQNKIRDCPFSSLCLFKKYFQSMLIIQEECFSTLPGSTEVRHVSQELFYKNKKKKYIRKRSFLQVQQQRPWQTCPSLQSSHSLYCFKKLCVISKFCEFIPPPTHTHTPPLLKSPCSVYGLSFIQFCSLITKLQLNLWISNQIKCNNSDIIEA